MRWKRRPQTRGRCPGAFLTSASRGGPHSIPSTVNVKVRDGQVASRPFYAAIGVTVEGRKDVLGLWAGTSGEGEGAKYWMVVLTELRNRGVADTMLVICDGLKGLPASVEAVCPDAVMQTCVIHLLRNSFRLASRKYWDQIAKDLKLGYTAPSVPAVRAQFEESPARRGIGTRRWCGCGRTPGSGSPRSWTTYDVEIRRFLFHQRDRVAERPLPARGPSAWALFQLGRRRRRGAVRAQVPLPCHP